MRKPLPLLLLTCAPLCAWGPLGHSLVARIAEAQLTPAARARVAAILGPGQTMSSVASWADQVRPTRRQTASWHFIDIPIAEARLNMARDCPRNDCVLAKIPDFRKTLRDPMSTPRQRAEALMFLIHFIGDMHQPLHCADNRDRGGNDVSIRLAGRSTNLHSAWDSGLLIRMPSEDQLFAELAGQSAKRAGKWRKGTIAQWAEESHKAAQKEVYGKLPKPIQDRPREIDADYEKMAGVRIREQIEKAGARLARVLNETLR